MKKKSYLLFTAALLSFTLLTACGNQAVPNTATQEITSLPQTGAGTTGTSVETRQTADTSTQQPAAGESVTINTDTLQQQGTAPIAAAPAQESTPQTPAATADQAVTPQPAAPQPAQSGNSEMIGEEKAKQIALEHAGVLEADASFVYVKLDYDDGVAEYEVEFYTANQQYDYDVDASTGTIRSFDYEIENNYVPKQTNTGQSPQSNNTGSTAITQAEASALALAKVPGASDANVRIELDYDDGITVYEGKIIYNEIEYDFEIDASTGAFLEWESESVYD